MTPSQRERDRWVQSCLIKLVAPTLTADGAFGPRSHQALQEFQRRVQEFAPGNPPLAVDGAIGPATIAALEAATGTRAPGHAGEPPAAVVTKSQSAAPPHAAATPALHTAAAAPGHDAEPRPAEALRAAAVVGAPVLRSAAVAADTYVERRVSVRVYGTIGPDSPLLVAVPGTCGPRRLHRLAAAALARMSAAAQQDLGLELRLASAWRAHRWQSRAQYEAVLLAKYGSIAEGKRWLAFDSPHETGLAVDIGVGGLKPSRASVDFQRQTPLHRWLVARAHEFGFHPYKTEPWHWEHPLSLAAYRSGVIAPDDAGPPEGALSFGLDDEDDDVLEDTDLEELPADF
ncbi:MAG: D-alanyl-D-alanine carboxypeptidase family protein [Myxococcales bacterium]|nr:D-alanyl-D-alanine carboxypeptidase family protein [Myxococcales bacterium]